MGERITQLLRTNLALVFLCVISIGVLVILAQGPQKGDEGASPEQVTPSVASDSLSEALAHSPLKDMPVPSTFRSFTYAPGDILRIEGVCKDVYRVTMIFPADVDYRVNTPSARHNVATPCTRGVAYSEALSLDTAHLISGQKYYLILASEGEQGIWHDPQ